MSTPTSPPYRSLREIGDHLLACALGHASDAPSLTGSVQRACQLLGLTDLGNLQPQLQTSVFAPLEGSRAKRQGSKDGSWPPTPAGSYATHPQPASLGLYGVATPVEASTHWQSFHAASKRIMGEDRAAFDTYCHLYRQYATHVASSLKDKEGKFSLPLYPLYQTICALAVADCESGSVLLVGGDLPGIQNLLYTIGSAGAAKSLRSRSFYLSLLNDLAVRYILEDKEIDLPAACVLINAGGNFTLLLPAAKAERVLELNGEINSKLLKLHGGELYLAIAQRELKLADTNTPPEFEANFSECMREIKQAQAQAKLTPFRQQPDLFSTLMPSTLRNTDGERYCRICQIELTAADNSENIAADEKRPTGERGNLNNDRCHQCLHFETGILGRPSLADRLARANYMQVSRVEERPLDLDDKRKLHSKPSWDEVIANFGYKYTFPSQRPTQVPTNTTLYRLNDSSDFLPDKLQPEVAYGFRYLANTTPLLSQQDIDKRRKRGDEGGNVGDIRSTRDMAANSVGIPRYGVLRMDVDSLGKLFSGNLAPAERAAAISSTLPEVVVWRFSGNLAPAERAAVSAALSQFFEGWLNRICEETAIAECKQLDEKPPTDIRYNCHLPYIIYAGGDDLFIVGSWSILPQLADRIRRDLTAYSIDGRLTEQTQAHGDRYSQQSGALPSLTISGGLAVVGEKFPVYQAAREAAAGEDAAKDLLRNFSYGDGKSYVELPGRHAFTLLGQSVGWEEYQQVVAMRDHIIAINNGGKNRSIINRLGTIANLYRQVEVLQIKRMREQQRNNKVDRNLLNSLEQETLYSRWQWRLVYSLRQFSNHREPQVRDAAADLLQLIQVDRAAIGQLGLAARWAEFVTRKVAKEEHRDGT